MILTKKRGVWMRNSLLMSFVIGVFIISGCSNEAPDSKETSRNPQSNEKVVELSYITVSNNQQIHELTNLNMSAVVKEEKVSGGTVYLYSKKDDPENVYGAYETSEHKYDLGIVGGLYEQMDDEILSIDEITLNGRTLLAIKGTFGANAPVQNYYSLEQNSISPFLTVDTGHARILDLDHNGVSEIVSSHGTPMHINLYKLDSGISMANLNEALNATNINLDEAGNFNVSDEDSKLAEKYKYVSGKLVLVN